MCEFFAHSECQTLKIKCPYNGNKEKCTFRRIYKIIIEKDSNNPHSNKVKEYMIKYGLIENWRNYFQKRSGSKQMTARPLEDAIRDVIEDQLSPWGVDTVEVRKKVDLGRGGEKIIADCIIKKEKHPQCIVSIKAWIGFDSLRESFGAAYFVKRYYGERNTRFFVVSLHNVTEWLSEKSLTLAKNYIDGVYSIQKSNAESSFDKLIYQLKNIYSE